LSMLEGEWSGAGEGQGQGSAIGCRDGIAE
jgi:hypothetical protein